MCETELNTSACCSLVSSAAGFLGCHATPSPKEIAWHPINGSGGDKLLVYRCLILSSLQLTDVQAAQWRERWLTMRYICSSNPSIVATGFGTLPHFSTNWAFFCIPPPPGQCWFSGVTDLAQIFYGQRTSTLFRGSGGEIFLRLFLWV